ncbi:MAG: Holliday junction branch migration DNA helicase RuvB, partial [Candidatus Berkelbacteria bacterium]|nr:Holliday junction branch migration DNA helicase RuvB [Candidatus Berkelbacteria bacterium]
DEIHRLNKLIEEVLYPAMEEFKLDIVIGRGPSARTLRLELPKFTLVGATTKIASLSSPLRDRFGVIERLRFYSEEEIEAIIKRSASILKIEIDRKAAAELAKRSRRTPRIANRLLKRVRDFAAVEGEGKVDLDTTKNALKLLEIDELGLDEVDREILSAIASKFGGGPVGLDALASASREDKDTIEDVYEPYLMQIGFIDRTPRGRVLTPRAYSHLGLKGGKSQNASQNKLI